MNNLKGLNLEQLRKQNLITTLNIIRDKGPISRIDICKVAGFSPTTCTNTTKKLIDLNIIKETSAGISTGGRKPIFLEINYACGYCVGIEVIRDSVKGGLFNLNMERIGSTEVNEYHHNMAITYSINQIIDSLIHKNKVKPENLFGIGIGVPGVIDLQRHGIEISSYLEIINRIDLHKAIQDHCACSVVVDNNGNLRALLEKFTNYQEYESLAYLFVDEGIGAGFIENNRIFEGSLKGSGEIGHITVDLNGPECFCGKKGCFERLGSIPAVLQKATYYFLSGHKTIMRELADNKLQNISLDVIREAYDAGDEYAKKIIHYEAEVLFHGIMSIVNSFNPQVIVIGGNVIKLGESILKIIRHKINQTIFRHYLRSLIIEYSLIKEDIVLQGAGLFAIREFFNNPSKLFRGRKQDKS